MWSRNVLAVLSLAACSGTSSPSATSPAPASPAPAASAPAAGSGSASAPAQTPAASAPGTQVSLAEVGLEPASLDRTADPCVDFYQFACGGWLQNHQIPADRARWARFSEIDLKNKAALQQLLEQAAANAGGDPASQKLGDYYASCMDEAAIAQAGTRAVKPLFDRIGKVRDARSWLAAVIDLHRIGEWVVWSANVDADLEASTVNVTYLDVDGLGLPDRDYYDKDGFADKRAAYQQHVAKMLVLAGRTQDKAEAGAADVMAIETAIAKLTKSGEDRRDTRKMYNPTTGAALAKQVRGVDWKAYWKGLGVAPSKKLVIGTPGFFEALDKLRAQFTWAQWSSYFAYHLAQHAAPSLPKPFEDQAFELTKVLTGVEQPQARAKRCIDATQQSLGELLGAKYVAQQFPPASKQTASALMDAISATMHDEIGQLAWMGEGTRKVAQDKLAKIVRMVGYPEKWRSYQFAVARGDFAGNQLRAEAFEVRRRLAKAGKPVDRGEWRMNAFEVNAYYEPTANNTALPAGILQPPFFGQDRSVAANLGGIGMVIGHELTHGFDDQGAKYDAEGNLKDWWQPEDAAKFGERAACVADQYGTFEALPKAFVNGKLTLGENIADLGGVKMAFKAYRALRKDAAERYVADGFTEDQQFFIAVGQAWCSKDRPAAAQLLLTVDPHSPPKFRVYGALRNLKEFAEAFRCAPGTPMNPAKTCSVW